VQLESTEKPKAELMDKEQVKEIKANRAHPIRRSCLRIFFKKGDKKKTQSHKASPAELSHAICRARILMQDFDS
jgi:hypothetical protein